MVINNYTMDELSSTLVTTKIHFLETNPRKNNEKSDNISNRKGLPKFYFYKTPNSFLPC